jgi:uncharacterized protein
MGNTLNLFRLQQIDTQITAVQTRIQNNQNILGDGSLVQNASAKVSQLDGLFRDAENGLKQAENELQTLQVKIQQNESSMYGKSNHTPKELIDLQNEITSQKKVKTALEEKILGLMQDFETAELNKNEANSDKEVTQNEREGVVAHIQE